MSLSYSPEHFELINFCACKQRVKSVYERQRQTFQVSNEMIIIGTFSYIYAHYILTHSFSLFNS